MPGDDGLNDASPGLAFTVAVVVGLTLVAAVAISFEEATSPLGSLLYLVSPYLGAGTSALVASALRGTGRVPAATLAPRMAALALVVALVSGLLGVMVFDYITVMSLIDADAWADRLTPEKGPSTLLRWRAAVHAVVLVPFGAILGWVLGRGGVAQSGH